MRLLVSMLCLVYILWLPVSNAEVLHTVLATLTLVSLLAWRPPARWLVLAAFLMLLAVSLMALVGSFRETPGLAVQTILWIGGLVIWGSWANSLSVSTLRRTLTVIMGATALLSGAIVLYVAGQQGYVPNVIPASLLEMQGAGFDLTAQGSAIRFFGLSTLVAAGPLAAAGALARHDELLPPRWLLITAAVSSVGAAAVAGRRAVLITTILAPLLYLLLERLFSTRENRRRIPMAAVLSIPMLLVGALFAWDSSAAQRARAAVADALYVYAGIGTSSGSKSRSDSLRIEQAEYLLAGWSERPLLGSGLGATLPGYQRNATSPWMFELQYHQLLYNGGIVSFMLLASALGVVAWAIIRIARDCQEHVPVLAVTGVAAIGMLLANASNPYLQAVGHGWALALVVGAANAVSRIPKAIGEPQQRPGTMIPGPRADE